MTGSVANPYIRDAPIPPSVRYRSLARYDVNKSESFSDHGRRERKKEAVEAIAVPLSQSDLLFGIPTVLFICRKHLPPVLPGFSPPRPA